MRVEMKCCNPNFGCPHCDCISCWDDGKLPYCSKIKDKPHVRISLLCQHCIKDIKGICFPHYWSSLVEMREIKWEKFQDKEYAETVKNKTLMNWHHKFNLDPK